jgi:hypothetical protein
MTDKPEATTAAEDDETAEAAKLAGELAGKTKPAKPSRKKRKSVELLSTEDELTLAALKLKDRNQTIGLRKMLAWFAIAAVSVQLIVANLIFGWYLWANGWKDLPSEIMIAWMSATVVEVIGIVVIIARNLFPARGRALTRRDLRKVIRKRKR